MLLVTFQRDRHPWGELYYDLYKSVAFNLIAPFLKAAEDFAGPSGHSVCSPEETLETENSLLKQRKAQTYILGP